MEFQFIFYLFLEFSLIFFCFTFRISKLQIKVQKIKNWEETRKKLYASPACLIVLTKKLVFQVFQTF